MLKPRHITKPKNVIGHFKKDNLKTLTHILTLIILDSSETISIGTVVAMYTPSANDIDLDYLEMRFGQDTIRLSGKNAILTTIQKVEKLDWDL